jgi:hypothetical protein
MVSMPFFLIMTGVKGYKLDTELALISPAPFSDAPLGHFDFTILLCVTRAASGVTFEESF